MRCHVYSLRVLVVLCVIGPTPGAADDGQPARGDHTAAEKARPYIERGMPSPARTWASRDYETAARILAELKKEGSLPLPRRRNDPSGGYFARMVNPENLALSRDSRIPVNTRVGEAVGILGASQGFMFVYLQMQDAKQPYGDEVVDLTGFLLESMNLAYAAADEFWNDLPETAKTDVRRGGRKKMQNGLATSIAGVFTMLTETKQYTDAQLDRFAERLPNLLPPLWPRLEPSVQDEYRLRLAPFQKTGKTPAIRHAATQVLEKLNQKKSAKGK